MVSLCLKAVLLSCESHLDRTLTAPQLQIVHANVESIHQGESGFDLYFETCLVEHVFSLQRQD